MFSLSNLYQLLGIGINTINKETLVSMNSCVIYDPQTTNLQGRFTIPTCSSPPPLKNCFVSKNTNSGFLQSNFQNIDVIIYDNFGVPKRICTYGDISDISVKKFQNSVIVDCEGQSCNFERSSAVTKENEPCQVKFEAIGGTWDLDKLKCQSTTVFPGAYDTSDLSQVVNKFQ